MIYVIAQLKLKPGTSDRACAEARKVVEGTVKEDGCLFYDFNLSVTDPTRLVAIERWESKEALALGIRARHATEGRFGPIGKYVLLPAQERAVARNLARANKP